MFRPMIDSSAVFESANHGWRGSNPSLSSWMKSRNVFSRPFALRR
jgi:hypothetical protein